MKFSLLPLLATALPILLVQYATPANAAALCIPGIYCPQDPPAPVAAPECSSSASGGNPPQGSSSSSSKATSTVDPKYTTTPIDTTTLTIPEPPYTTTPGAPGGGSTTAPTYTPGGPGSSSSSSPEDSSSVDGHHTATTTVTVTGQPAPTGSTCSTGPVQCCNSVEPSSSENASKMLGLLGIVLQGTNVPVGLTCVPISVIGAGSGGTCNAQTVCCENNEYNGLVNIGCTPINIGL